MTALRQRNSSPPDPAALIDVDGHRPATSLNWELLEEIAASTNGYAFTADAVTGIDDVVVVTALWLSLRRTLFP